jgi:hypothetical protein
MKTALLTAMCLLCISCVSGKSEFDGSVSLDGLREDHPRLVALAPDIQRTRALVDADEQAALLYEYFQRAAEELAASKPVFFPDKGNVLGRTRTLLKRVYLLGLLARISDDPDERLAYANEAWRQLKPAVRAETWTPGSTPFLAVGEATHALAIAYDWFYIDFSEAQRAEIREAIIEKGLSRYLDGMAGNAGWSRKSGNWAFVCQGGAVLGALAVAGEDPATAEKVLKKAVPALSEAIDVFSPDGAWWEGPIYWGYATRYAAYAFSAMRTALGHDFELPDASGFSETGLFAIYISGPSGATFNYADAGDGVKDESQMFWLAERHAQPVYALYQRENYINGLLDSLAGKKRVLPVLEKNSRPYPLNLLWYSTAGDTRDLEGLPLARVFRAQDVEIGVLRSGWGADDAFLAVKGGVNGAGHAHLDLGSFVLDAHGYRWAMDLGKDEYQVPGYFDSENEKGRRWKINRVATRGHNTLLINGSNQKIGAVASVSSIVDGKTSSELLVDMTDAYSEQGVQRAERHFTLDTREPGVSNATIVDSIQSLEPVTIEWAMHTRAKVGIKGNRVTLSHKGQRMILNVLEPVNIEFKARPARPERGPKGQAMNEGVTRLSFEFDVSSAQQTDIRVVIASD